MQLSITSKKILSIFFSNPNQKFFINELIRKTGLYPNSVQRSLLSLIKQDILISSRSGRFRFYELNASYKYLTEIKQIITEKSENTFVVEENKYNWVKIVNRRTSMSFSMAWTDGLFNKMKKIYGISIQTSWYNDITYGVYHPKEELMMLGKAMAQKITQNKNFINSDIRLCQKTCDGLVSFSRKISSLNLPNFTNKQLINWLRHFYQKYANVFAYMASPHGIENFFESQIKKTVTNEKELRILLSPISTKDKERDEALIIADYAKKHGFNKNFYKLLDKHCQNYCWLPLFSIYAQPLTQEYFESEIKNILDRVKNPKKEILKLHKEELRVKRQIQKIFTKLNANRFLIDQVNFFQEYISLRTYRKNAVSQAQYYHLPLFYEAGNRLGLNKVDVKLFSHEELILALSGKLSRKDIKSLLTERNKGWALLMLNGKVKIFTGTKNIIETIERYRIIAPSSAMQRVVKGSIACRGKATGQVKIIKKISELSKVEKGDILVTKMTTPDYVVAMQKAAAIVTDEGGITCHAAIVSREFNIPCIIGTKNATQILSDNDLVEVDALAGVVRVIEAVEVTEDIKVIPGKTIYKGKVRGKARIILDAADFNKIQSGDILITPQTTPEYLSALYRVKGFIADEDSLTSHSVLYGKALRLPSIMGTEYARNVIQDDEEIELNATNGLVRRFV